MSNIVQPHRAELSAALKLVQTTAAFTPVVGGQVARVVNAAGIIFALVQQGWLPPHMRQYAGTPEPMSGVQIYGGQRHAPEYMVQRGVSLIRATARCEGVQADGTPARLTNEREVLATLMAAGWYGPWQRDETAASKRVNVRELIREAAHGRPYTASWVR